MSQKAPLWSVEILARSSSCIYNPGAAEEAFFHMSICRAFVSLHKCMVCSLITQMDPMEMRGQKGCHTLLSEGCLMSSGAVELSKKSSFLPLLGLLTKPGGSLEGHLMFIAIWVLSTRNKARSLVKAKLVRFSAVTNRCD